MVTQTKSMCSVDNLSWHTATSVDVIDIEANRSTELASMNDRKVCVVSDSNHNTENENFIQVSHRSDETKAKTKRKDDRSRRRCWRTKPKWQHIRWQIPWIIILISTIQVSEFTQHTHTRYHVRFELVKFRIHNKNNLLFQLIVHFIGCNDTINALIFVPTRKSDVWRLFSYVFLHSGSMHLYPNVILQVIYGNEITTTTNILFEQNLFKNIKFREINAAKWI